MATGHLCKCSVRSVTGGIRKSHASSARLTVYKTLPGRHGVTCRAHPARRRARGAGAARVRRLGDGPPGRGDRRGASRGTADRVPRAARRNARRVERDSCDSHRIVATWPHRAQRPTLQSDLPLLSLQWRTWDRFIRDYPRLSENAVGNRKIVNPLAMSALDTHRNFVRAQKFAQKALLLLLFAHVLQRSVTHHGPRDRHFGAAFWVFARELCDGETNTRVWDDTGAGSAEGTRALEDFADARNMKSLTFEQPRPLSSAPIISVMSLTPWSFESVSPAKLGPRPRDVESEREDRASPTSNLPVPSSSLCLFPSSDPMRLSMLPPPLFFCSRRTLRSNASASSSTTMASSPSIARAEAPPAVYNHRTGTQ